MVFGMPERWLPWSIKSAFLKVFTRYIHAFRASIIVLFALIHKYKPRDVNVQHYGTSCGDSELYFEVIRLYLYVP